MMEYKMVKLSVEVRSSSARFRVGVQARSIREALGLVGGRHPRCEVRVVFPIEPSSQAGVLGTEHAQAEAAREEFSKNVGEKKQTEEARNQRPNRVKEGAL